jgi:transcriptional regulator with XRE-family HTH domain/Zn-dependent peptidase ImmA (M78 family)
MTSQGAENTISGKNSNLTSLPRMTAGTLTLFGRKLRALRFEHSKRIFDLAQDLDVSSSSVSAWETGRREVSEDEIQKIGHIFSLNESEIADLREAAELSKQRVIIEPSSIEARKLAIQIKKRINELTSEDIQRIMTHLKSTTTGRIRWDMRVAKKSIREIESVAQMVRRISGTGGNQSFDVVKFYDELLDSTFFYFLEDKPVENTAFEIFDDHEMPKDTRAMTMMFPPHIVISNSAYEEAAKGGYAGRWIMAHELGHLFLLHGFEKRAAANNLNARGPEYLTLPDETLDARIPFQAPKSMKRLPRHQSAEMQADDFAGELLMPRHHCAHLLPHNISLCYGVSIPNAKRRLRFIGKPKVSLH